MTVYERFQHPKDRIEIVVRRLSGWTKYVAHAHDCLKVARRERDAGAIEIAMCSWETGEGWSWREGRF